MGQSFFASSVTTPLSTHVDLYATAHSNMASASHASCQERHMNAFHGDSRVSCNCCVAAINCASAVAATSACLVVMQLLIIRVSMQPNKKDAIHIAALQLQKKSCMERFLTSLTRGGRMLPPASHCSYCFEDMMIITSSFSVAAFFSYCFTVIFFTFVFTKLKVYGTGLGVGAGAGAGLGAGAGAGAAGLGLVFGAAGAGVGLLGIVCVSFYLLLSLA